MNGSKATNSAFFKGKEKKYFGKSSTPLRKSEDLSIYLLVSIVSIHSKMRAAARQAQLRITEQTRRETDECGDDLLEARDDAEDEQEALSSENDSSSAYEGDDHVDQPVSYRDSRRDQDYAYNVRRSYNLRDIQGRIDSVLHRSSNAAPTRIPLRSAPANPKRQSLGAYFGQIPVAPMSGRPSNGVPRQNMRDAIVQQWDPPRRTNGQSRPGHTTGAPPTPPMNDSEEEHAERQRTLREKIMQQVEDNGIERPQGYTVSYHAASRTCILVAHIP